MTEQLPLPHRNSHGVVIETELVVVLPQAKDIVELVYDLRLVFGGTSAEILVRQRRPAMGAVN